MSDIIKAREILETLVENVETVDKAHMVDAINVALQLMYRKKHKRKKAPRAATPVSVEIRDAVIQCVTENPSISTRELSEKYNVNHGRISEILAGQYGEFGTESTDGIFTERG